MSAAIVLATGGAGTFALWSGNAVAQPVTISSGTAGLTVNDATSAVLAGMDATKLGPGTSVVSVITLKNTGSTALSTAVTTSLVTANTGSLADELTIRLTPVPSVVACTPGLPGESGRISTFGTFPSDAIPAGGSALYCLELALDADAPSTVQGGSTSFSLTFTGTQVAP